LSERFHPALLPDQDLVHQDEVPRVDLHLHSTFSDGSYTPEQLVAAARERGLTTIALTDHDTTDGLARFLAAGLAEGLTAIPGIELSVAVPRGTLHVLGYGIDPAAPALQACLQWVRDRRTARNRLIFERLRKEGMEISWEEACTRTEGGVMGRPHIADLLVEQGYVKDRRRAFSRYLARGRPAYVERERLPPQRALEVLRAAGGVPVMAHPVSLHLTGAKLQALLSTLQAEGLMGLERYHPRHPMRRQARLGQIAESLGLLMTGGSDFHGDRAPASCLGFAGSVAVPPSVWPPLREAMARAKPGQAGNDAQGARR